MKALNKTVAKKYAYVKNGVIFDIKYNDNGDSCVVEMSEETVPYITVDGTRLYFNEYIEIGDTYSANDGFKKTIHSTDGEDDKEMTYQDYYRELCIEQMSDSIIANYTMSYAEIIRNIDVLSVPCWMVQFGCGSHTLVGITQIPFQIDDYNTLKENKVKEFALESASKTADKYGYKLTKPAKASELQVEKIEG